MGISGYFAFTDMVKAETMIKKGINIACSWSGGKDSCYSLMQAIKAGATLRVVLNAIDELRSVRGIIFFVGRSDGYGGSM